MLSFALLSLLGVAVAIALTRIRVFVHTDPGHHSVWANVGRTLEAELERLLVATP